MARFFPNLSETSNNPRSMVFVDGENLAIRYTSMLREKGQDPAGHIRYEPGVFVWSQALNNTCVYGAVFRKYYYTSVQGDDNLLSKTEDQLRSAGIDAPRVFKKTKSRGSKRVDISLATDMLTHAAQRNYEIAVLIAGDEDYVPLVEAVKQQGRRVYVWFLEDGLSSPLKRAADHYANIGEILFSPEMKSYNWR